MTTRKKGNPRAAKAVRGTAAAPLCRLVFVRPGTKAFHFGKWQTETAKLQARVDKFNAGPRRKFDLYIQVDVPPPPAQPMHIPALGAKPGQFVIRYKFPDGDTGDMDYLKPEQRRLVELEKHIAKSRAAQKAAGTRRRKLEDVKFDNTTIKLDKDERDALVSKIAAEEKQTRKYGYIQRTAQRFPGMKLDHVRDIIQGK